MTQTKEWADFLRTVAQNECMIDQHMLPSGETMERIAYYLESEAKRATEYQALQDIGKGVNMDIDQLIQAQNEHFPGSRILSRAEVNERWLTKPTAQNGVRHYTDAAPAIASALLQHPVILFYEYGGYRGARYGVNGAEYISGFGLP